jgi:YD repeat-containing protein
VDLRKIKINRKTLLSLGIVAICLSCLTIIPSPSFGSDVSLVGCWQFNEGAGNVAADTSGKGNCGTITEPAWVCGKIGKALQFAGKSYVEIPHNEVLNPRNAITIEAWIYPASNMQWRKIVSKSLGSNTDYCIFQGSTNNLGFSLKMGTVARTVYSPAGSVPLGKWTHVAGTYDGTCMRLYINGIQVSSIAICGQINAHAEPLRIGGDAPDAYFAGMLDEISIYNIALTAAEILNHYEAASQPAVPTVVEAVTSTDGTKVLLTFNKEMASLPPAPAGFAVSINGVDNPIQAVALNTSNKATIEISLTNIIYSNAANIQASYTAGTVTAQDGSALASFINLNVANQSTIAPPPLVQKYTYDELHRLTDVLLPGGQRIQYRYDLGGNLISVKVVE